MSDGSVDASVDVTPDVGDSQVDAPPPACDPTRWPDGPAGPGGLETMERHFALRDIVLNQEGRRIGWDTDGLCTASASTRACRGEAEDSFVPDGRAGLDNSFGATVLPTITSMRSELQSVVRDRMEAGETMIVTIQDWNGTSTDSVVTFTMIRAAGLADGREEPRWDGTDRYLQDDDGFVEVGPLSNNKIIDRTAYLADGLLVGKIPDRQPIVFPWLDGATVGLPLLDGRVTARLGPDQQTLTDVWIQGRISVLDIRRMWDAAGFCEDEDIRTAVDAAVDEGLDLLVNDGVDGRDLFCDAISIAIEFQGRRVELGDRAPVTRPGQCDGSDG